MPHQRRLSCLSPREAGFATLVLAFLCSLGFYGCGKTDQAAVRGSGSASVGGTSEPVPITNMVRIKPGTFFRIKYTVTLTREFWIAKYEVTQAEYWTLMSKNPSYFTNEVECPVERVNYLEATAYCEALTHREREAGHLPANYLYRLPTEAEWEYACRAGTTNFYSFGEATTEAAEYAWTMEDSEERTHRVGQKRPNPWGLYDMHGNVWEWVLDWYAPYPPKELTDPVGPPTGKFRVFRGGGWNQEIQYSRSANRFGMEPRRGINFVGFRVALGQAPPEAEGMRTNR